VVSGRPAEVIRAETLSGLYGVPVEVLRTGDGRVVVVAQREPVTYHAEEH
jgi:zinc/manganese transport system ATP-binding protein